MTKILKTEEFIFEMVHLNKNNFVKMEDLNKANPTQKFIYDLFNDTLLIGYDKLNNGNKKEAFLYFENFAYKITVYLTNIYTQNIDIEKTTSLCTYKTKTKKSVWGNRNIRYNDFVETNNISFSRKPNCDMLFTNNIGYIMNLNLKNENGILDKYGYEDTVKLNIEFNFGLEPSYMFNFDFGVGNIPPDYKKDYEKICSILKDICASTNKKYDFSYMLGKVSLRDKLSGYELLKNKLKENCQKISMKDFMLKVCDILKENDNNCSIKFTKQEKESKDSNNYYGSSNIQNTVYTINAILVYNSVEHILSGDNVSGMHENKVVINCDDIENAFCATANYYDDGFWIHGDYVMSPKLKDVFNN